MDYPMHGADSYRVEVSGWDRSENFFVEKTILDWRNAEKKEVSLRVELKEGSVVFVRLLQTSAIGNHFPIAYQAKKVSAKDADGRFSIQVDRLRPRCEPAHLDAGSRVAQDIVRVA
jgi:hypothetical protein